MVQAPGRNLQRAVTFSMSVFKLILYRSNDILFQHCDTAALRELHGAMTFGIMTFSIMAPGIKDTAEWHNAGCHGSVIVLLSVFMLSVIMLSVAICFYYTESNYAEYCILFTVFAKCFYATSLYAKCHYAECRSFFLLYWKSLCWVSHLICCFYWVLLCWMLLCWTLSCWVLSFLKFPNFYLKFFFARIDNFCDGQIKNSRHFWKLVNPKQFLKINLELHFQVLAGMVLLLINNLTIIYNNLTKSYNNYY